MNLVVQEFNGRQRELPPEIVSKVVVDTDRVWVCSQASMQYLMIEAKNTEEVLKWASETMAHMEDFNEVDAGPGYSPRPKP